METQHPPVVSPPWLEEHRKDPDLLVVDATTIIDAPATGYYEMRSGRKLYEQAHVPGAVYADMLEYFADTTAATSVTVLPSEEFAKRAGALGIGEGVHVVAYDQGVNFWATRLWWNLRLEGFDSVSVLSGGLHAWTAAGLPTTSGVERRPAATFRAGRRPGLLADKHRVLASIDDPSVLLVSVGEPELYSSERAMYARPGQIPSSVNVRLQSLTGEDRTIPSLDIVREELGRLGALDKGTQVITYCGSGAAATYAAFLLDVLGQDGIAVYDGSMTEWALDPSLPLEVAAPPGSPATDDATTQR